MGSWAEWSSRSPRMSSSLGRGGVPLRDVCAIVLRKDACQCRVNPGLRLYSHVCQVTGASHPSPARTSRHPIHACMRDRSQRPTKQQIGARRSCWASCQKRPTLHIPRPDLWCPGKMTAAFTGTPSTYQAPRSGPEISEHLSYCFCTSHIPPWARPLSTTASSPSCAATPPRRGRPA